MKLIDLSYEIYDNMPVYPGDSKTGLSQVKYLNEDKYNNYRLDSNMHSGTHIDSPMHLTERKEYISEFPLSSFIGDGCLLDVRDQHIIGMKAQYEALIKDNSIVLLYTGYNVHYGSKVYYEDHPYVDTEFCRFLTERRIKMLGMDLPSPDYYPFEVHKMLFEKGIFIIENLTNLDQLLKVEKFEVMAFPLKIRADSSMIRAVARQL